MSRNKASFYYNASPLKGSSWPFGSGGDLIVNPSTTVHLTGGLVYDYVNIHVYPTGILIIDDFDGWTILGAAGSIIIDGTLTAKSLTAGLYTASAPNLGGALTGESLSYTSTQKAGGGGGGGQAGAGNVGNGFGGGGGAPGFGNGGGGGGGGAASNQGDGTAGSGASSGAGGGGGTGGSGGGSTGGPGGLIYSVNGTDGNLAAPGGGSGGGGGGSRGKHGGLVYVKVKGTFTGSGIIDLGGDVGGNGGNGGGSSGGGGHGGGAGGGAGGTGGKFVVRYLGGYAPPPITVTGGTGGTNGTGGPSGAPGENGDTGTVDAAIGL